jgi:CubicO group peptidase (beta-lactamase class C family)
MKRLFLLAVSVGLFAQAPIQLDWRVNLTPAPGWTVQKAPQQVTLAAPEGDLKLYFLPLPPGDETQAVQRAWTLASPNMKWPFKFSSAASKQDGWERVTNYSYEVPPNQKQFIVAITLHNAAYSTIALIEGQNATLEKRGTQIGQMLDTLLPMGLSVESFANRKPMRLTPERVAELRSFLEQSMKAAQVPGVGIALIDQGKIVYEGGIGVKTLGGNDPIDANTLFMAASNTKGMTTLLLSVLADQGKLRWDQPVTALFPAFRLGDPEVTKQVLAKHLVCACTGMPRQDYEWLLEFKDQTPKASLELLAKMKPTSKFGEVFQYSNLMVSAAGYMAAHILSPGREYGAAYDAAMDRYVFHPIGMKSTTFSMSKALAGNYASPHSDDVYGKPQRSAMDYNYSIVPYRPAGGVWTSAHDFARYVLVELNRGTIDGKRIVSEANLLERRKPQISTGDKSYYGMGLSGTDRNGTTVISHGGSLFGYKSDFFYLPDHGIGAVTLTNSDSGGILMSVFQRKLLEMLFDGQPKAQDLLDTQLAAYRKSLAKDLERLNIPASGEHSANLLGSYAEKDLGPLIVRRSGKDLIFDLGEWSSPVASRRNDDGTISFITIVPGFTGLEFVKGVKNGQITLTTRDAQHEYVFTPTVK